jgi:L-lactate utilization protein LutC
MDRLTFLARLRERLKDDALEPETTASAEPRPAGISGGALVDLFAGRLRESGGEVAVVASPAAAWAALERLAGERGWLTVACAPGVRPEAAGFGDLADEAGVRFTREAAAADFGLCEADWAVAETGSIVVKAGAEVRRGYSLLPPAVGFFVPRSRIRATMGDVLRELPAHAGALPSCVSFISGPSGTSDLAAVHVVGVHGPGEVFAWVIEDGEPAG